MDDDSSNEKFHENNHKRKQIQSETYRMTRNARRRKIYRQKIIQEYAQIIGQSVNEAATTSVHNERPLQCTYGVTIQNDKSIHIVNAEIGQGSAQTRENYLLPQKVQGTPTGTSHESTRMRNIIKKQKQDFAKTNLHLELGYPDRTCFFCGAKMWKYERTSEQQRLNALGFSICCGEGKVDLPLLRQTPEELLELLNGRDLESKNYRKNIRTYNNIFAFTSMGGKIDNEINIGNGPYVFRLNGQTYHRIGSLLPADGSKPMYAQLYMFDADDEVKGRMNVSDKDNSISDATIKKLMHMLDRENELVKTFRQVRERFKETDYIPIKLRLVCNRVTDGRYTNEPINAYEFAGLIPGDDLLQPRDIVVEYMSKKLVRISDLHPSYMALQYPLLFPYGEDGFRLNILHRGLQFAVVNKRCTVTMREDYAYRLQQRNMEGQTLLRGGRLLLQFIVDAWCAVEHENLSFIVNNQSILRSDVYNNIVDYVNKGDTDATCIGKRIILPASFTGSPRYMTQNFLDCMTICKRYSNPDLFITFTCNPKWPEFKAFLEDIPNADPTCRPDIIARVFKVKVGLLIEDLTKNHIFGRVIAIAYTIEFQKRGLPHVHIVLWLSEVDQFHTTEDIDEVICAEIPDKEVDPEAYAAVCQFMIHGPCGALNNKSPCMHDNKCIKHFPKAFNSATVIDSNGYPVYRRRDNGRTISQRGMEIDNRFIVPYNRGLIVKYQAHINVEWCNKDRLVKYLFKYVNKGSDKTTMVLENSSTDQFQAQNRPKDPNNEVERYVSCRYVSASEACWRLFDFPIQMRRPFVFRLRFHLKNQQEIYFREDEPLPYVLGRINPRESMFIQWMESNKIYPKGKQLTYVQFPEHFWWDSDSKRWWPRKKDLEVIGRLTYAHPSSGERFYLRMLLNIVKGPTSFEDIRTVDEVSYGTFQEACYHRGILDSDKEWHCVLDDAAHYQSGKQLRELFVTLLLFSDVSDPLDLWKQHWRDLSDDILYMQKKLFGMPNLQLTDEQIQSLALSDVDQILKKNGRSLSDFPTMPSINTDVLGTTQNRLVYEEYSYDRALLYTESCLMFSKLNQEQLKIFKAITESVYENLGKLFFVYGHGGTGKTFLWKTITARLRSEGKIVLAVASSGIASLLIEGGRTAHSRFKIPIEIDDHSMCDVKQNSMLAELIKKSDLIVWDEAPMNHRFVFEAVDRTFRDIMRHEDINSMSKVFGGKTVLLGGDFRQILPVLPKKGREEIVLASLSKSLLWKDCIVMKLTQNMRVETNVPPIQIRGESIPFCQWVLNIGDGIEPAVSLDTEEEKCWIELPKDMLLEDDGDGIKKIVAEIYANVHLKHLDINYLRDRAILTPINKDVDQINKHVLQLVPGDTKTYHSADSICKSSVNFEAQESMYPVEYLNSLQFNGVPNHELQFKVGAPIMLLRNLNPSKGLCNGTRLLITQLAKWVIEGVIITGSHIKDRAFIPRINMTPSNSSYPFTLKRRQFPLALCYAMTINKSQGQTMKNVGLFLPKPVFSHGQLYVALSRVTSPLGLKILCHHDTHPINGYTKNVVYQEVLEDL